MNPLIASNHLRVWDVHLLHPPPSIGITTHTSASPFCQKKPAATLSRLCQSGPKTPPKIQKKTRASTNHFPHFCRNQPPLICGWLNNNQTFAAFSWSSKTSPGCDVFSYEYVGYSMSRFEGATPSEARRTRPTWNPLMTSIFEGQPLYKQGRFSPIKTGADFLGSR